MHIQEEERGSTQASGRDICIDPKTYCKLGHFHLLLEDYAKGLISLKFDFRHPIIFLL